MKKGLPNLIVFFVILKERNIARLEFFRLVIYLYIQNKQNHGYKKTNISKSRSRTSTGIQRTVRKV